MGVASLSLHFSDGLIGGHVVCPGFLLEEQHLRHFSCGTDLKKASIQIS